jgi:hypothetical protein
MLTRFHAFSVSSLLSMKRTQQQWESAMIKINHEVELANRAEVSCD